MKSHAGHRAWARAGFGLASIITVVAVSHTLVACGSGQTTGAFSVHYPDNDPETTAALMQRLRRARARPRQSLAIGVSPEPHTLFAYDLGAQRLRWQQPCTAESAPVLAGTTVITQEADGIIGRGLNTGQRRFRFPDGERLLAGADGEEGLVVFTLSSGGRVRGDSAVVAVRGSRVLWKHEWSAPVGSPAVVGDVVLVPWSTHFISALEANTGREFARLRIKDDVVGHVFMSDGELYAGQSGVFRISDRLSDGMARRAGRWAPPEGKVLPGTPNLMRPVYTGLGRRAITSASHHIQLAWRPAGEGGESVRLAGDQLYLAFYRIVLGLDPETYALRWVSTLPHDAVGVAVRPNGLMVADEQGAVQLLDPKSGQTLWKTETGQPSLLTELHVAGLETLTRAPDPLLTPVRMISEAIGDHDTRLVTVQLMAAKALAQMKDPAVTEALLALCEDALLARKVRDACCGALATRKNGSEFVLDALGRRADYLAGTQAPPLGALALAAKSMALKTAVPMLIEHLQDPATPAAELPAIVEGIAALGNKRAALPLTAFMRLYHADARNEHLVDAVGNAAQALAALQGHKGRALL